MFVFQDDTFDTFSHPCFLPSCSGVASKTLRTHLRLSTLAHGDSDGSLVGGPNCQDTQTKWLNRTCLPIDFPTKNGTYMYIYKYDMIYIYIEI